MVSYPHMLAEDAAIWSSFLRDWGDRLSEVWYDVHVGQPMVVPGSADPMLDKVASGISRKRIDVIARVPGGFWVIEVKPFCSHFAFGQVMLYRRLFVEEYRPAGAVWPVVVCDLVDADILPLLDDAGVVGIEV